MIHIVINYDFRLCVGFYYICMSSEALLCREGGDFIGDGLGCSNSWT